MIYATQRWLLSSFRSDPLRDFFFPFRRGCGRPCSAAKSQRPSEPPERSRASGPTPIAAAPARIRRRRGTEEPVNTQQPPPPTYAPLLEAYKQTHASTSHPSPSRPSPLLASSWIDPNPYPEPSIPFSNFLAVRSIAGRRLDHPRSHLSPTPARSSSPFSGARALRILRRAGGAAWIIRTT